MDTHLAATIGRGLIGLLFLWSGLDKIRLRAMTGRVMEAHGIPFVRIVLPATIGFEVACSLLLFANLFIPVVTALMSAFVIVASLTIPVRDLQSATDPKDQHLLQVVLSGNVGLIGGLFVIFGTAR